MELWEALAVVISIASGLAGVFFSKEGKTEKVKGIGWLIVVLILVAGSVSLYQVWAASKERASSEQRLADTSARLRRTQAALMTGVLTGADLSLPVGPIGFTFEIGLANPGTADARPKVLESFVGPLPALLGSREGEFRLEVGEKKNRIIDYQFKFRSTSADKVEINDEHRRVMLSATQDGAYFGNDGLSEALENTPFWSEEYAEGEASRYTLNFVSNVQARALVASLVEHNSFGYLLIPVDRPGSRRTLSIRESLEDEVALYITFSTGVVNGSSRDNFTVRADSVTAEKCQTGIRARLSFRLDESITGNLLKYNMVAHPDGISPEICGIMP